MTITKVTDISKLPPPEPAESAGDNLRAAFDLVDLCYRLHPWTITRGVEKVEDSP